MEKANSEKTLEQLCRELDNLADKLELTTKLVKMHELLMEVMCLWCKRSLRDIQSINPKNETDQSKNDNRGDKENPGMAPDNGVPKQSRKRGRPRVSRNKS